MALWRQAEELTAYVPPPTGPGSSGPP
jgi:hypothetical protein